MVDEGVGGAAALAFPFNNPLQRSQRNPFQPLCICSTSEGLWSICWCICNYKLQHVGRMCGLHWGWMEKLVSEEEVDFDPSNNHDQDLVFVTGQHRAQDQPLDGCQELKRGIVMPCVRSQVWKTQQKIGTQKISLLTYHSLVPQFTHDQNKPCQAPLQQIFNLCPFSHCLLWNAAFNIVLYVWITCINELVEMLYFWRNGTKQPILWF